MKILIVEDDYMQSKALREEINSKFGQGTEVEVIDSELGFKKKIKDISLHPPTIILMDVMLRWTKPSPDIEVQPDYIKIEGFYKAGFRCQKLLMENDYTNNIPVIFYTVLDKSDIQNQLDITKGRFVYTVKNKDVGPLISQIRKLIKK